MWRNLRKTSETKQPHRIRLTDDFNLGLLEPRCAQAPERVMIGRRE
jgi:hypothetical protein